MRQIKVLCFWVLLCLVCTQNVCAASYRLFGGAVTFDPAPLDPLFREPLADPFSDSTSFRRLFAVNEDSVPHSVLASDGSQYVTIPFEDPDWPDHSSFWQMKSAVNIGLLRFTAGPVSMEGYIRGGLNTVFQTFGATDALGFDGMYGAGLSVRLFDKVTVRAGFHHFSGHWGDEILTNMEKYFAPSPVPSYVRLEEYTRGNTWQAAFSCEPDALTRFYAEADLPMSSAWIRPGLFVPSYVTRPGSSDSQFTYITGQEGLDGRTPYASSYLGLLVSVGVERRFPVWDLGSLFLACDVKFHQDGQIVGLLTDHAAYDPPPRGETEVTVGGGFEFDRTVLGRKFRFEGYYHDGRFPLLNYFFQKSQYLVCGIAISG